ncbi:MAG: hypothetical protein CSA62_01970 [Planctomycetota bacterium]|nr:MAG: hypothetical protein CSA62_01970 [Planctomycetota bacterium]
MSDTPSSKISDLLDELSVRLSEEEVDEIRELVEKDEEDAALESLCEELYENDVRISADVFETIEDIGKEMALDSSIWAKLQDLILPD